LESSTTTTGLPAVLRHLTTASSIDEAEALDFFGVAGLPLSSVVLGLLDQSDDCIKVVGTDGTLKFMNCNGKKAMQIEDFSLFVGRPWHSLWPEESQGAVRQSISEALAGRSSRFEAFCPTAEGDPRWWEVSVSPLRNGDGGVGAILSTSRDISARRRRELELETVAAEMRHRLRNAHTIGAAIALAASRDAPAHRDFGLELASRLTRLAEVQSHLLDLNRGIDLRRLCELTVSAFSGASGKVNVLTGPDLGLGEQGARTLALVLGELATNSVKYGALGRGGEVSIGSVVDGDILVLTWDEDCDGTAEAPLLSSSSGQGAGLVRRMVKLMEGEVEGGPTDGGYRAAVTLPLAKVAR
jgi:PAS domain S-box-containing protein